MAATYADGLTAAGTFKGMKYWWQQLCKLSPKFVYFPAATKSWLITKVNVEDNEQEIFGGSGVQKTIDRKRHL